MFKIRSFHLKFLANETINAFFRATANHFLQKCCFSSDLTVNNIGINIFGYTGCPNKHGNSVTNSISSLLWISIVIQNFRSHNIIMSARVYFMKTVIGCKDVSIMSLQVEQWRRSMVLFCNFLVLLSTTVWSQNINKQIVNIADKNLTDYSFLSRYHYTKSKNYLKRRYRICHWVPMFISDKVCKCLENAFWWLIFTIVIWNEYSYKYVDALLNNDWTSVHFELFCSQTGF